MSCPLCAIPQHETLLFENDKIYLVPTKDSKGHKIRIMAVTKRHTTTPTMEETMLMIAALYDYMNKTVYNKDWFLVISDRPSIPNHIHMIALDTPFDYEKDPWFIKTLKIHFPLINNQQVGHEQ